MAEFLEAGLRLAIYARVSTEEQRDGQTIDSQIAELEQFALNNSWLIAGIYKDDGWSGGMMERPELDRLRDDAQNGVFNAVLINDVDRLARDVAHLGIIKRDLEKKGARVIFRKLPSDASPTSNLMVNILGSFAEFERELIADRVRRGRRHKVERRKQYLGSNTSYGYRYHPMNHSTGAPGVLEIDPSEAAVVRQMFEWVDRDSLSAHRVVSRLNASGIRPKKGAATWGKSSVLRILKNEMYAGVWHYNKAQSCEPQKPAPPAVYRRRRKCSVRIRPKAEWIPLVLPENLRIIPRDKWERVQQQIARNTSFSPRNEKHSYLLKSLVICGACGGRYVGDPCHGAFYYRCIRRCKQLATILESRLDATVTQAVTEVILNPAIILQPLREADEAQRKESARQIQDAAESTRDVNRLANEEERLLEIYRTGVISPATLAHELEKLKSRRAAAEMKRAGFQTTTQNADQVKEAVSDYCLAAAANLAQFGHKEWRDLLRIVVAEIVFHGDRITIRGRIPVDSNASAIEFSVTPPLQSRR